jgi:hypothetical protein
VAFRNSSGRRRRSGCRSGYQNFLYLDLDFLLDFFDLRFYDGFFYFDFPDYLSINRDFNLNFSNNFPVHWNLFNNFHSLRLRSSGTAGYYEE